MRKLLSYYVNVQVAPHVPGLLEEMVTRFFAGRLRAAASHPTANFVVQALLSACSTVKQASNGCV
jgi:hypothetical protein